MTAGGLSVETNTVDDATLDIAVLDLLRAEPELYPARILDLLRARESALPAARLTVALDRLFCERRVARLWHRYMLPDHVDAVRTAWLHGIARYCERAADPNCQTTARGARQHLQDWDGWQAH